LISEEVEKVHRLGNEEEMEMTKYVGKQEI
jgi:hypothetical protein